MGLFKPNGRRKTKKEAAGEREKVKMTSEGEQDISVIANDPEYVLRGVDEKRRAGLSRLDDIRRPMCSLLRTRKIDGHGKDREIRASMGRILRRINYK